MNTKITYLYRDASNYKQCGSVVVRGVIAFADLEPFLYEDTDFVPDDVGLEHPGVLFGNYPTEDDHPFCELEDDFEPTNETATVDAAVLIDRFRAAHAAGWPDGDRDCTKGRVVPKISKVCGRCGATSTGGVWCPNGCGRV